LTEGPLAVMVWFHGGGYVGGGNIQYPGHFLAAKGVIVVVPNYRLDSFGNQLQVDITGLLEIMC
jgi:carboxylesterase type B